MNVYSVLTRRSRAGLLAGLLVGLLVQPALAAEDFGVHAAEAAGAAEADREFLRAALEEYMRAVKEEMHNALEDNFRQRPMLELQLTANEVATRG